MRVQKFLENFSKTHKSLNLVLSSVGSFMSRENVLFLTPTMTEELMNYNDDLINILTKNNITCGKYYTKIIKKDLPFIKKISLKKNK